MGVFLQYLVTGIGTALQVYATGMRDLYPLYRATSDATAANGFRDGQNGSVAGKLAAARRKLPG